jgi:hypothetical protein
MLKEPALVVYENDLTIKEILVIIQFKSTVTPTTAVLWSIAPCCLVDTGRSFRGSYCLHHSPDDGGQYLPSLKTSTSYSSP